MKMDFTMIRKALLIIEENEPCSLEPLKTLGLPEKELTILLKNLRDAKQVEYIDVSDSLSFDIMDLILLPPGRNALDFLRCNNIFCKFFRYFAVKVGVKYFSLEYKRPDLVRYRH